MNSDSEWLTAERTRLVEYLATQLSDHGAVPDCPDWYVAPYVAIWRVGSLRSAGSVGWWAIVGDLPTDYASSSGIASARDALRHFGTTWAAMAERLSRGETDAATTVGDGSAETAEPLRRRATMLLQIAEDDENW